MVTAYATQARPNRQYELAVAPVGQSNVHCPRHGAFEISANVRYSSSSGFIPPTSAPVWAPPGTYQICFLEVIIDSYDSSPAPVYFTVT